jgi:hypothetical protein
MLAAGLAVALSQGACDEMNRQQADAADVSNAPATRSAPRQPASQRTAASRDRQRRDYDQEAADLQAGLDAMNSRQNGNPVRGAQPEPEITLDPVPREVLPASRRTAGNAPQIDTSPIPVRPADAGIASPSANRTVSIPDASAGNPLNRTPEQRRADAVLELSSQLRPDIAAAKEPLRAAMPLLGLELIEPGSGAQYLDSVKRAVSPEQRRTLESAAAIVHALGTDPNLIAGNPGEVAQALRAEADRLAGTTSAATGDTLALGEVAICQRVDGFGRFTPLASNAFFAGKPAAMILYTEIENFSQKPSMETPGAAAGGAGAQWSVELGQTVRLYYEVDGSEQLVIPETVVRDASRSKRHDFFLVQRIDLPRTLTVGNYVLKVTVRDAGGGAGGGAVAERIVPIRIVADASAVGAASNRGMGSTTTSPTATSTQPGRRGTVADRRP